MKILSTVLLLVTLGFSARGEDGEEVISGSEVAKQTAGPVMPSSNKTFVYRKKLIEALFKDNDYDKNINPDQPNVRFGVALIRFDAHEDKNTLESSVWLRMVWHDERLQWNQEDFGGVSVIRYDSKLIWTPDVVPYNSADPENMMQCWPTQALIYPNGEVLWVPPCKLITECELSLREQPYGEQNCFLKFGSWVYDGNTVDLSLYNNETAIDTSDFSKASSKFEVVSTIAEKQEKIYDCCPEPYPSLFFNMTFKRTPGKELYTRL